METVRLLLYFNVHLAVPKYVCMNTTIYYFIGSESNQGQYLCFSLHISLIGNVISIEIDVGVVLMTEVSASLLDMSLENLMLIS